MTPDQLIDRDQRVSKALGTTKNISCANSRQFGKEIAKYIDSKEKKKKGNGKKTEEEKRREMEPAVSGVVPAFPAESAQARSL